jgi:hypothetical protein
MPQKLTHIRVVFLSLLALTITAGLIKVMLDRSKYVEPAYQLADILTEYSG